MPLSRILDGMVFVVERSLPGLCPRISDTPRLERSAAGQIVSAVTVQRERRTT